MTITLLTQDQRDINQFSMNEARHLGVYHGHGVFLRRKYYTCLSQISEANLAGPDPTSDQGADNFRWRRQPNVALFNTQPVCPPSADQESPVGLLDFTVTENRVLCS
ncbi:MAG TPA: hypothetical protein VGC82_15700, partial [Rhodopila sp.]